MKKGARIDYWLSSEGSVCFGVDGTYKGILFSKVKTSKPVWPLIDLVGQAVEIALVSGARFYFYRATTYCTTFYILMLFLQY